MMTDKQAMIDVFNTKSAQVIGVGAVGSVWTTYLDLGFKVLSVVYLSILIYSLISNIRRKNKP